MKIEEKIPYLKVLMYIALADETIESEELVYFQQLGNILGLNEDELKEIQTSVLNRNETLEDIVKGITERSTKLNLIYELLALCYVDNCYSLVEKNGMRKICKLLGIEESKLNEFEAVMEESIALQNKINTLLER